MAFAGSVQPDVRKGLSLVALLVSGTVSATQNRPGLPERLSSPDGRVRTAAIRAIGERKVDLRWRRALQRSLEDRDRRVVFEGLRAWAKIGAGYDEELTQLALEEEGDITKLGVKGGLQAWQREIVGLLSNIAEGGDAPLREEALRTMCKLTAGANTICPPLALCGTGADQTLSSKIDSTLEGLAKDRRKEFLGFLDDRDPDVVYNAVCHIHGERWKILGNRARAYLSNPDKRFRAIGMWIASESPLQTRIVLVAPSLEDADKDVRQTASAYLGMTEEEGRRIALEKGTRSVRLRALAVEKSGYRSSPERDAVLKRLLDDPEPQIRSAALGQLDEEGVANDLAIVQRGLDDPAPSVRAVAIVLGAQCRMPGLLAYVKAGLVSENREERESALWSTMQVEGSAQLTPEIVRAVDLGVDDNWMAAPNFDDPNFAYLVGECLKSKNPEVRQLLCFHFSHEGPKPVDLMVRLALDPDPNVARLMLYDLGSLSDSRAYDAIVAQTASKSVAVRTAAIGALGQTKRASALPILRELLTDEKREIRLAARYALAHLKESLVSP